MRTNQKIRRQSSNRDRLKGIEKYSSLIFKIIGVLFLILALYYTLDFEKNGTISKISKLISSRSHELNDSSKTEFSWDIFKNLLLIYIPGCIGAVICLFISNKKPKLSYYLSNLTVLFITIFNCKIFLENWIASWKFCYSNYIYSSIFLIIPIILFLLIYWKIKKPFLITLVSIYFYLFLFQLLIIRFSYTYTYVLIALLLYSLLLFLITRRNNDKKNNIINQFISFGFILIFVIRQLYVNHKFQSLNLFFTIGFCYFLLFYGITFFIHLKEKGKQFLILNWVNTIICFAISYYVLYIFKLTDYIIYPTFFILIIHIISLLLINKLNFAKNKTFPIDISTIVLISLVFSLVWKEYKFELFFGTLSVFSIYYAKISKNKFFIWLSLSITLLLIVKLIYLALKLCFSILELELTNTSKLITFGFINCGIVLISVLGVKKIVSNIKEQISNDWFNRTKFIKFLNVFILLNLFIFIEWTIISIIYSLSENLDYVKKAFIIIVGLFNLYVLKNQDIISEKFKNIAFHSIFFFSLLTPLFYFREYPYVYKNDITIKEFIIIESLFHYLSLFITLIILFKSLKNLNKDRTYLQHFFEVLLGIIIILILCVEYDFIVISYNCFFLKHVNIDIINNILFYNQLLPYSIIILLSSICILAIGIVNRNRFLRFFSLFIIAFDLLKVFIIEFDILSENEKVWILITIGIIFLLISWIYKRMKSKKNNRITSKK